MENWIIGIIGVSALGILIDVLLSESSVAKYVRSTFGIIVAIVVISPIISYFASVDLDEIYSTVGNNTIEYSEYLERNYREIFEKYESYIESNLEKRGISCSVDIEFSKLNGEIDFVRIEIEKCVIDRDTANKYISDICKNRLNCDDFPSKVEIIWKNQTS